MYTSMRKSRRLCLRVYNSQRKVDRSKGERNLNFHSQSASPPRTTYALANWDVLNKALYAMVGELESGSEIGVLGQPI